MVLGVVIPDNKVPPSVILNLSVSCAPLCGEVLKTITPSSLFVPSGPLLNDIAAMLPPVFFAMIFITQIESLIELSGIMSILYSYSLGLFFSIFVTWVIPRFWKLLNLAN